MSVQQEKQCTHLVFWDKQNPTQKELLTKFEKGSDSDKYDALRSVIMMHMSGEPQQKLLFPIIRYVLPSTYKPLKKLVLYYFEIIERTTREGKLLDEMILVCSHLRNDLTHPNEYIRGCVLRFLCKIKEQDLLEPLIQPIIQNLEHRHSYVRRNAVLTVYSIYKQFQNLIPDAPELIEQFLDNESDVSGKRNAFIMLFDCDQQRAIKYLRKIIDQVSTSGDVFQLVLLNLLRKMCKTNPAEKSKYLKVISSLMESKSNAVVYQCAGTLVAVSSSPAAIKAAASCYIRLLLSHSDNNIKLIVLDRLLELKNKFPSIMEQVVMELLRALSNPELEFRKKVLDICLDLVSPRNIEAIINTLKKEVQKSQETNENESKNEAEYRRVLVQAFHKCSVKFADAAPTVLIALDHLGDTCGSDAITFAREIIELSPKMKPQILEKLCYNFSQINLARVHRIALWVLGDYSETSEQIVAAVNTIKAGLGSLGSKPEAEHPEEAAPVEVNKEEDKKRATSLLRQDGTYATQVADPSGGASKASKFDAKVINLLSIISEGNFYVCSVVCSTLTKLALRYASLRDVSNVAKNQMTAQVMSLLVGLLRIGVAAEKPSLQLDKDTFERITLCIRLLSKPNEFANNIVINECKTAFANILNEKGEKHKQQLAAEQKERANTAQADSVLNITQLRGKQFLDSFDFEEEEVAKATANALKNQKKSSRLSRVVQLTGFSDPVYAEASVTINQYDIMLDVLVVNQTNDTLQNLTLELATVGDLKLCERPQAHTLGPYANQHIKANIKVSSTETGIIFGNIVYDVSGSASEGNCVVLNDVHIDIMDYIAPATCDDMQFRNMWFEFEWENKIPVAVTGMSLRDYLNFLTKITNMNCLTPESALEGECEFLSANLHARSSFGEDALANLSIERNQNGKLEGFVRIRSKTQGIALSLGKIITAQQKALEAKQGGKDKKE